MSISKKPSKLAKKFAAQTLDHMCANMQILKQVHDEDVDELAYHFQEMFDDEFDLAEATYAKKPPTSKFEEELALERHRMDADAGGYAGQHANIEVARVRDAVRFLLAHAHRSGEMPPQEWESAAALHMRLDGFGKRIDLLEERATDKTGAVMTIVDLDERIKSLSQAFERLNGALEERVEKLEGRLTPGSKAGWDYRIESIEKVALLHEARVEKLEKATQEFQPWQIPESPFGLLKRIQQLEKKTEAVGATFEVKTRLEGHHERLKKIENDKLPLRVKALEMYVAVPYDLRKQVELLDNRTAYQSKCDGNNVDAIRQLNERLKKLEAESDADAHVPPPAYSPPAPSVDLNEVLDEPQRCGVQYTLPPEWRAGRVVYAICSKDAGHPGPHGALTQADIDAREQVDDRLDFASVPRTGLRPEQAATTVHYDCPIHGLHLMACCEGARRREPSPTQRETLEKGYAIRAMPPPIEFAERPKIVCLVGSTRFSKAFADANLAETLAGNAVFTVGSMTHSDADILVCARCKQVQHQRGSHRCEDDGPHQFQPLAAPVHAETKKALDALHKRKIEMADEILVLNAKRCIDCGGVQDKQFERWGHDLTKCAHWREHEKGWVPYIGESTRSEIFHALKLGKLVRFLNPQGRMSISFIHPPVEPQDVDVVMHDLGLGDAP